MLDVSYIKSVYRGTKMSVNTLKQETEDNCMNCVRSDNCQGQCNTAKVAKILSQSRGIVSLVAKSWTPRAYSSG
mgnify:CR=1 FL=1